MIGYICERGDIMRNILVEKDTAGEVIRKKCTIKVISSLEKDRFISNRDAEMDARAMEAVHTAIEKAKFCKKPVARYDIVSKKVYVEYPNGEKKYVD